MGLSFAGINWLAVLVAFLLSFVIGWVWYSDNGFFKQWKSYQGLSEEDMEGANMGVAFGGTMLANLLGIIVLAMLMEGLGVTSAAGGLALGALVGLVYRGGAHALHNGFALRHPMVTVLDASHDTLALAISGGVLGIFG